MAELFLFILVLSFIGLIIGLIKPSIVIKWKSEANRVDVAKTYLSLFIVSLILMIVFIPKENKPQKTYLEKNINKTLTEIRNEPKGTIKKVAIEFAKANKFDESYYNTMYDCLADNIYTKSQDFKVEKMLEWCKNDYDNNNTKPYFNKEWLLEDFSPFSGVYRPLEDIVKDNMNDPSSYEHSQTKYNFVLYGTKRPHMSVMLEFRGKNAYGGVVKQTISCKVDAKTKELFDIK